MTTKAWKRINIFRSLRFKLDRKTLEIKKSQVKVKYSNTTMQVKFVSKFFSKQNG